MNGKALRGRESGSHPRQAFVHRTRVRKTRDPGASDVGSQAAPPIELKDGFRQRVKRLLFLLGVVEIRRRSDLYASFIAVRRRSQWPTKIARPAMSGRSASAPNFGRDVASDDSFTATSPDHCPARLGQEESHACTPHNRLHPARCCQ